MDRNISTVSDSTATIDARGVRQFDREKEESNSVIPRSTFPKVLFVAFACQPRCGSEPGVGWNFVEEASKRRPVWVLTNSSFRPAIEKHLKSNHLYYPIHPIYVGIPGLPFLPSFYLYFNLYYYLWQFFAARAGKKAHQIEKFDLVQHVSFERFWMHSAGASIGAPFLFGPVGGGDNYPASMRADLPFMERVKAYWSDGFRKIFEMDPLFRRTLRRAIAVIPSVKSAESHLEQYNVKLLDVMPSVAPELTLPDDQLAQRESAPFRFISLGRMPRWRGIQFGIQAFAEAFGPNADAPHAEVEYLVIGKGADLPRLRRLAAQLGVAEQVRFAGDLSYQECIKYLSQSRVLIHPAMRDSAGLVLESLVLGVPVVCTDVGLPSVLVNENCGHIVCTGNGPAHVVDSIRRQMLLMFNDKPHLDRLSQGAVDRSSELSRKNRGDRLDAIHLDLIARSKNQQVNYGLP